MSRRHQHDGKKNPAAPSDCRPLRHPGRADQVLGGGGAYQKGE